MSEPFNEVPQDNAGDNGQAPVANESPSMNPAWEPLLNQLPSQLHPIVTPHLREWDSGVTQMAQKIHSEYEPWKPLIQQQVDPTMAMQSWQAMQNLEADPMGFVQAVMEHYGLQLPQEQGQEQLSSNEGEQDLGELDFSQHPEFQRISGMTEQMAQLLIEQHNQQEAAELDQQVDRDIQAARDKHGDFDEDYVLQRMMYYNEDADTAAQAYKQFVNGIISQQRNPGANAPIIMGGGGGVPSAAVNVASLSPQDRRALVAQRLAQAAQNR